MCRSDVLSSIVSPASNRRSLRVSASALFIVGLIAKASVSSSIAKHCALMVTILWSTDRIGSFLGQKNINDNWSIYVVGPGVDEVEVS